MNPLEEYNKKRDFTRTGEPKAAKKKRSGEPLFVIQKHEASRLHYDFRLEMEGVLKSWAVPKGIPYGKGDKKLAVHVEDHPFDYAGFEGIIPKGNYGAGTVMVWDTGTYENLGGNPVKDLEEGRLHILLHGKKLEGEWALVKMQREENQWLLLKSGEDAPPLSAKHDDESVLSGRTMKQIAAAKDAEWISNRGSAADARAEKKKSASTPRKAAPVKAKIALPSGLPHAPAAFSPPMQARLIEKPPTAGDWIYELKFDGFRVVAVKSATGVELISRSGNSLTSRFREIADAVNALKLTQGALDGEIVALDEEGKPSFQLLQSSETDTTRPPICYYVFDALNIEGRDTRALPLTERKRLLEDVLRDPPDGLRYSGAIQGDPHELLAEISRRGLEGLIAKKSGSLYETGQRSGAWVKLKCVNEEEFVIGGYTPPDGTRQYFGALIIGFFEKGKLLFTGKVGTGFSSATLKTLHGTLQPIRAERCPFANLPTKSGGKWGQGITAAEMRRCAWVKPELVCQVKFAMWTRDGKLRQPVYLGLREDKKAADVIRELPGAV